MAEAVLLAVKALGLYALVGLRHGVRVMPGPTFGGSGTHLRLPYWHRADQFREGLLRLK